MIELAYSTSNIGRMFNISKESKSVLTTSIIGASGVLPFVFAKHFLDPVGVVFPLPASLSSLKGLNSYATIISLGVAAVAYAGAVYGIEKHGGVGNFDLSLAVAGTVALVAGVFNMIFDPPVSLTPLTQSISSSVSKIGSSISTPSGNVIGANTVALSKPKVGYSIA